MRERLRHVIQSIAEATDALQNLGSTSSEAAVAAAAGGAGAAVGGATGSLPIDTAAEVRKCHRIHVLGSV